MPIIAKADSDNFEKVPTGTIQAVCVHIFDIGMQEGEYAGKRRVMPKIIVSWEVAAKITTGDFAGQPFMVSKFYTNSLAEKANLRKDLESWRGKAFTDEELKGFDVESIKGMNCLLSITATDSDKRKVAGVMALPTGMNLINIQNPIPSENYMKWIERERAKAVQPAILPQDPPPDPTVVHADAAADDLPF